MEFPPIIDRELRLASRRALTYWMRLIAALATLTVATPVLLIFEVGPRLAAAVGAAPGGGIPPGMLGQMLLNIFSITAFFTSIVAGWYFASDAIAHERREGTLELLFLAPIRPREVVLSKLFTVLWRAAQWLLGVVPIFALPILAGGVRGQDLLVLAVLAANTAFWSIATSLYASSKARTVFEALSATLVLQIAFFTLPFALDLGIAYFSGEDFATRAGYLNPIFGWVYSSSATLPQLAVHVALVQASGWIAVALTVRQTARQIRQNPSPLAAGRFANLNERWKFGGARARKAFRHRLLDIHPIRWLVERERGPARFLFSLVMIVLIALPTVWLVTEEVEILIGAGTVLLALFSIVLSVMFAAQATRFMVESRRTGALELMLVSPLSSSQILRGHFRSLLQIFAAPIVVLVLGQLIISLIQISKFAGNFSTVTGPAGPGANLNTMMQYQWIHAAFQSVVVVLSYLSLAWTGVWMGLACRQASLALFASLGLAKILPAVAVSFAQASLLPMMMMNQIPAWLPFVSQNILAIAFHLCLIFVVRYQLLPDLRRIIDSPHRFVLPVFRTKAPPRLAP